MPQHGRDRLGEALAGEVLRDALGGPQASDEAAVVLVVLHVATGEQRGERGGDLTREQRFEVAVRGTVEGWSLAVGQRGEHRGDGDGEGLSRRLG